MAQPKPYFRSQRQKWYVQIDGKQILLGEDKKEAFTKYHEIMAGKTAMKKGDPRIVTLIVEFTKWLQGYTCPTSGRQIKGHRDEKTAYFYVQKLLSFAEHIGEKLTVSQLKVHHVTKWLEECHGITDENDPSRFPLVRSVKRLFNWAAAEEIIDVVPLKKLKLGEGGARTTIISEEQWQAIFDAATPKLHDLLNFVKATGCRPHDLRYMEARHLDVKAQTIHFPAEENPKKSANGKTKARTIYLNDAAFQIAVKLAEKNPTGKLFRNTRGKAWTRDGLVQAFGRIREKSGVAGLCCYVARHTWANDALDNNGSLVVAQLMGHKDTRMLTKHYAHLEQKQSLLLTAAKSVKTASPTISDRKVPRPKRASA